MKPIVGIEFSADRIRAVTISPVMRRPLRRFDVPWRPDSIEDAVRLLQEHLGSVRSIGVAVSMDFLLPKEIKLPPVSAVAKRRIIFLEPDRFFPTPTPVVIAVSTRHDLVEAADASATERWISALEQWAPVENFEGSPNAFARAAGHLRFSNGVYEIGSAAGQHAYAEVRDGLLVSARIARSPVTHLSAENTPDTNGIPGSFVPALGAALGTRESPDEMLLSDERHSRIRASRIRSLAFAGLFAAASTGFVLLSAAQSRERYLDRLESATAALRPRAAAAQSLQGRINLIGVESNAARQAQDRVDPLAVITAVSRRLPTDAVVMTVRGSGDDWQISGTAKDAAAIIPALDADPALENVRFLEGTSRFTEGRRTYETFSIGFRVRQTL